MPPLAQRTALVVPCYDEAHRLDREAFESCLAAEPRLDLVLVDDGSRDETLSLLRAIEAAEPKRVRVIALPSNLGKAEAVRSGMQHALATGAVYAGYWDADLATPLDELPRFAAVLDAQPSVCMVFGARVQLLGRSIERRLLRHYGGRVFATLVSNMLRLEIYDTQCGAKLFRSDERVRALFSKPFLSRWIFDVEIVARLMRAAADGDEPPAKESIVELPLRRWRDVRGGKIGPADVLRSITDLLRVWRHYRPRRA